MSLPSTGESATILPWIWPDAGSLVQLSQSPVVPWNQLKDDPGLVLFLMTQADPAIDSFQQIPVTTTLLHAAEERLDQRDIPWIDWRHPAVAPLYRTTIATCQIAEFLADYLEVDDPATAWCAGILAYARWLCVAIQEPDTLLNHLTQTPDEQRTGRRDRHHLAWKIAASWNLPNWAKLTIGAIDYSPADVERTGGVGTLQAIIQTAITLAEQWETDFGLSDEFDCVEAHAYLSLNADDLNLIKSRYLQAASHYQLYSREWCHPLAIPALNRELHKAAHRVDLYDDEAATILFAQPVTEDDQQRAKLEALAELAAGASHEINNPLAVISANSQYLLKQKPPENQRKSLEAIIRQTERVHSILRDLMLFARPPAPQFQTCSLNEIAEKAVQALQPVAADKAVQLDLIAPSNHLDVDVDQEQIIRVLSAIIRNGIEAASPDGYVRIKLQQRPESYEFIIEDTGQGIDDDVRLHLFDPFYSGRSAGRGRGLGLSVAWRLAQLHGGEVRFVPIPNGLTRFVLSLPRKMQQSLPARKSA